MKNKKIKIKPIRVKSTFIIFSLVFLLLSIQLFRRMVLQGEFLGNKAEQQFLNEAKISPKRGSILDRNGRELAVSGDVYKVNLDLLAMQEYCVRYNETKEQVSEEISGALGMDNDKVLSMLDKTDNNGRLLRGMTLERKIEKDKIDKLKEVRKTKKYNFMIIENDSTRLYPNNNFLAHALGIVDLEGEGVFGLEKYYDKELMGVAGIRIAELDKNASELPYEDVVYTEAINGKDVILSVDESIQYIAQTVADKALKDTKAKGVTIIVTNPKNGEVLAMVNKPDFNLNDPRMGIVDNEKLQQLWRNKAVNDVFEPGSTFKITTISAALEEKVTFLNDDFYCKGFTVVNGTKVNCWKPEGHGSEKLIDILENSCNPGFMELGRRLGQERLNKYIYDFGFGKPAGIDLTGEAAGIIKPTDQMTALDLATISFGQTDAASPIQILAALNTIMNDGVYSTPHLMKEVVGVDKNGGTSVSKPYEEKNQRQVISKDTANTVAKMLEETVSKGSGKQAYVEGLGIAGKTGTAQKANIGGKGYVEGKFISSFIGAAPYDNPKVSVFVSIDEPEGEHFGGIIASPVAKELFQQIFNQMGINPLKE
ncbi:penicillin-binding transpeptidase domain-containing protein [Clostridium algidicarnis]|uniref:Stage V sporulation protein D (Sporulation-specific penicillin-binding protein) n=2 Tax=Clostridium algidicarnis TaxID=37659 RepID=A0A2S6FY69_9CLOT|nr:penicillin-binding transpeptidase domain-containing protein [Clostridium algidicarnis]MBB6698046.1 stage V sporulation protein D [Clostridium algidicarnis]MBU3204217.1 stage V sporulation protein D [Clostridium algidicarnis]MBU3207095.1 stage V sporulation protein D [Clostridium algidicarnis]MBU3212699.1 stage V sporulation protein D [Clostridium algidicarnis]MBU3219685.1 stage V sporulation protein D [Clostridium algidicarnis]